MGAEGVRVWGIALVVAMGCDAGGAASGGGGGDDGAAAHIGTGGAEHGGTPDPGDGDGGDGDAGSPDAATLDAGGPDAGGAGPCVEGFSRFFHGATTTVPTLIAGGDGIALSMEGRPYVLATEVPEAEAQLSFGVGTRGSFSALIDMRLRGDELVGGWHGGGNGLYSLSTVSSDPQRASFRVSCSGCGRVSVAAGAGDGLVLMLGGYDELLPFGPWSATLVAVDGGGQEQARTTRVGPVAHVTLVGGGDGKLYLATGDEAGADAVGGPGLASIEVLDTQLSSLAAWTLPPGVAVGAVRPLGDGSLLVAGGLAEGGRFRLWLHRVDGMTGAPVWPAPAVHYDGLATALDVDAAGRIAVGAAIFDGVAVGELALSLHGPDGAMRWPAPERLPAGTHGPEAAPRSAVAVAFQSDGSVLVDGYRVIARHRRCD